MIDPLAALIETFSPDRLDVADDAIVEALHALTRATALLGFSEGKEMVQMAHITVSSALDGIRARRASLGAGRS